MLVMDRIGRNKYTRLLDHLLSRFSYKPDLSPHLERGVDIRAVYSFSDLAGVIYLIYGSYGDQFYVSFQHAGQPGREVMYLRIDGLAPKATNPHSDLALAAKRLKREPIVLIDCLLRALCNEETVRAKHSLDRSDSAS